MLNKFLTYGFAPTKADFYLRNLSQGEEPEYTLKATMHPKISRCELCSLSKSIANYPLKMLHLGILDYAKSERGNWKDANRREVISLINRTIHCKGVHF